MAVPMANDPPFATLNHFVADLGIPNESDLLRIGISDRSRAGQARHPDAARWRLAIDDRDALTSTPRAALIVAIDRGVRIAGAKNFRPALEQPPSAYGSRIFHCCGAGVRKANFDGAQVTRSG